MALGAFPSTEDLGLENALPTILRVDSHLGGKVRWSVPPVTSSLAAPVPNTHLAHSLSWGPRLWQTWQTGALCPHRQLMHNSNFSSSNGSTEDLFRDSIDSCDNDITEKVSPGALCAFLGRVGADSVSTWALRVGKGTDHTPLPLQI